ncbi:methyltransferase type 11 [Aminobacter anthyllidis]|uniref:Methyltransferase type 11 n=1 Tax=Aminobacter anthyllidis TaxID=1035067 RepID=A0A9X1AE16_9HYPH|nr:small ribosomal subunit Rsm22 family protein [Aminobacter anthyllidis]MBT1157856.1 methyltransferase type 11 [Aminobacter anthyllidis]
MELPAALRAAVDRALEGVQLAELQRAADTLSSRYRAETRDGKLHLSDEMFANAYLATRLPATFAAVRASLESAAELMPEFEPKSLLDVGAGPGTALWAASDCWPTIASATMLEGSQSIRKVGVELSAHSAVAHVEWRAADAAKSFEADKADLVTLAYVLDELSPAEGLALVERLWAATNGLLVVIEPGTPAGWRRMMAVRSRLIELGAYLAAPCPHSRSCPIVEPDWCHFSRRVARSRLHRLTKRGEVPWEDEKYIFLAASRMPAEAFHARVLAPARGGSGKIHLKLCQENGSIDEKLLTKRDGELFKTARRADWGDVL